MEEWLDSIGLGRYAQAMKDKGWDSMEAINLMTNEDKSEIFTLVGHKRLFDSEHDKRFSKTCDLKDVSAGSSASLREAAPPKSSAGIQKASCSLGYMKSSAYYPNPGTPKRIYSNNLLKEIHASVAPYKGGFVEWFIAEVDARWELMQDLEKMEKSILYWTGDSLNAYGKFLTEELPRPCSIKHLEQVGKGIMYIEKYINFVTKSSKNLKKDMEDMFNGPKMRKWAGEPVKYRTEMITLLSGWKERLEAFKTRLQEAESKLEQILHGLPAMNNKSLSSRKKKESRRKSRMRKARRIEKAAKEIFSRVTGSSKMDDMLVNFGDMNDKLRSMSTKRIKQGTNYLKDMELISVGTAIEIEEVLCDRVEN